MKTATTMIMPTFKRLVSRFQWWVKMRRWKAVHTWTHVRRHSRTTIARTASEIAFAGREHGIVLKAEIACQSLSTTNTSGSKTVLSVNLPGRYRRDNGISRILTIDVHVTRCHGR
jgi:hypothetical protein